MKTITMNTIRQYFLMLTLMCVGVMTAQAATFTVTNTADSGAGSLRDAVGQANASPVADTIEFSPSLAGQTITLTSGALTVTASGGALTINGLGAAQLSVSGNNQDRVFLVDGGATLTVNNLTMKSGYGDGGCISSGGVLTINNSAVTGCQGTGYGGGIYNPFGTLTVNSSVISGNSTPSFGGGIVSLGTTTITKTSISSNSAGSGGGLAIAFSNFVSITDTTFNNNNTSQQGTVYIQDSTGATITNSTISGNSSGNFSGAIHNLNSQLSLINCTVANNSAQGAFGAILIGGATATITLSNTLVAANSPKNFTIGPGSQVISNGYNLDTDGTSGFTNGVNGDIVGTLANPINALLGPLQNNGGPTLTQALLAGSPAIDAGNSTLTTDQRGFARPFDSAFYPNAADGSDIGAFEYQGASPTNKDQCKNGGWMTFDSPRRFRNQGDCIQFVNTGK